MDRKLWWGGPFLSMDPSVDLNINLKIGGLRKGLGLFLSSSATRHYCCCHMLRGLSSSSYGAFRTFISMEENLNFCELTCLLMDFSAVFSCYFFHIGNDNVDTENRGEDSRGRKQRNWIVMRCVKKVIFFSFAKFEYESKTLFKEKIYRTILIQLMPIMDARPSKSERSLKRTGNK